MPTLRFRFPGGRYHATPTGHHVNEGQIEWPPSPWRLLRALIACGFNTQHWLEIPPEARQLIEKLAATLPSYRLPPASAAHSRHYMPLGSLDKGREKTSLVFDTWANIGDGKDDTLDVHWDCELTDAENALLANLAECLNYLGRSESWVEVELVSNESPTVTGFDAFPHDDKANRPGRQWEQVSLMSAVSPNEYDQWRSDRTRHLLDELPLPEGKRKPPKKLLSDRARALEPYPSDLLDCLTKDTAWWKQRRWSQPPGAHRVIYWRRADALQVGVPQRGQRRILQPVNTMLLALATPSGNKSALPTVARTLPQAELFHRSVVGIAARGRRINCPELTGYDAIGNPLKGKHEHAHVLPVDLDCDGHLDHIIIHAAMGLGEEAQRAIRTMKRTWMKGGVGELQVAVAGVGNMALLGTITGSLRPRVESLLPPAPGAQTWISLTPFVPPRFMKKSGKNSLPGQINAELESRGLPVAEVELLKDETIALRHYVRVRRRGGQPPPVDVGYALQLKFDDPITGPLSLGYASHFGLGLFRGV